MQSAECLLDKTVHKLVPTEIMQQGPINQLLKNRFGCENIPIAWIFKTLRDFGKIVSPGLAKSTLCLISHTMRQNPRSWRVIYNLQVMTPKGRISLAIAVKTNTSGWPPGGLRRNNYTS